MSALAPFVVLSCAWSVVSCVSDDSGPSLNGSRDAGLGGTLTDATFDTGSAADAAATADQSAPPADAGSSLAPEAGAWVSGPALPAARTNAFAAAPGNGYLYVGAGYVDSDACNVGTSDGRLFVAPLVDGGAIGAWAETTVMPSDLMRSIPGVATANGFIYVAGGAVNAPSWNGDVWFAKPAADGTVPTWTQATQSVSTWVGSAPVMAAYGGQLFVGGGFDVSASPTNSSALFVSTLDATTGQPGAWTPLASLPAAPSNPQLVISTAGYAYFFQGSTTAVYVASLAALLESADAGANEDAGSIWQLSPNALPVTPGGPTAFVVGTHLFVLPGGPDLYVSELGADGSLGPWTVASVAPTGLNAGFQGLYTGGTFYVLGEDNCGDDAGTLSETYYVPVR